IKCGRCGNSNADDVLFCQYCGTRLAEQRLPEQRLPEPLVPAGPQVTTGVAPMVLRPGYEPGFRLVVVHRDGSDGITYNLLGDQIDIGRTEGDLLFEDPHLAARHARIVASPAGRVLTPLENRNGVYVRLRGPVDLQEGDHILL